MGRLLAAVVAALLVSAAPAAAHHAPAHPQPHNKHQAPPVAVTPGCEFLLGAGQQCLAPFPSDFYTRADATSPTGRRVNFAQSAMPANTLGTHIDPAQWNRNDGFSPGITILLRAPGLDNLPAVQRTGLVPVTDPARSFDRDQPVVVIDTATGRRWPIWAELDS